MNALYQRLKELSKSDFESLIDQLLQARYPTASIIRVRGEGGDRGVDSYSGKIGGRIAIWQDKHFPDGLGKSQRKHILESIKVAFEKHLPIRWTLCVPIDLTVAEREWFETSVVPLYIGRSKIDVMQASNIVFHLLNYRRIREAYFPDAISDVATLKRLVMSSGALQPRDKARLGIEYVRQFIDDLERQDGRFRYEVTAGRSINPAVDRQRPGLMASIFDGEKTIGIFARDMAALEDDPIRMLVRLSNVAKNKMDSAIRTGKEVSFDAEEIVAVDLPNVIANIVGDVKLSQLGIQSSVDHISPTIPIRVSSKNETSEIVYDYVPFRLKYLGTEELTFVSEGNIPVIFTLTLSTNEQKSARLTFESRFEGFSFKAIQKSIDFIDVLADRGAFAMKNLEKEMSELKIEPAIGKIIDSVRESIDDGFRGFVRDALIVSNYLSTDLVFPQGDPTEEDYELLFLLKSLATGEEFEIEKMQFEILKATDSNSQSDRLLEVRDGRPLRFVSYPHQQLRVLFGMPINTGRMILEVDQLRLANYEVTRRKYDKASDGENIEIVVIGPSKARYSKS